MPLSTRSSLQTRWPIAAAALIAAAGLGYAGARFMTPKPAPAAGASPETRKPKDALVIDRTRIAVSGVQLETVGSSGLASEIVAQASVAAEPGGQAILTARAPGAVARINKRLGDPVRAGEVLALIESREAAQIAAARGAAAAKADLARKVLARERRLYEQKVSPRQDFETAQAELAAAEAEARSAAIGVSAAKVSGDGRYVMVVSPINGRITAMGANLGAFVQPEAELFRIADPSRIQVEASVTAQDAQRIAAGDPAVVEVAAGEARSAVVRAVTPSLNEQTRAATVVLDVTGGAGTLQPGQLLRVRITSRRSATSGIVAPEEAIQTVEGRDVVFVRTPKGFRAQPVVVGQRSAGRVQIVEGLRHGDVIAARNAFLLKAELGKGEEGE